MHSQTMHNSWGLSPWKKALTAAFTFAVCTKDAGQGLQVLVFTVPVQRSVNVQFEFYTLEVFFLLKG